MFDPSNKRDQIIKAAQIILLRENYENMKTASIAKEAGIAEGTIYRYFSGKRELFIEVLHSLREALADIFMMEIDSRRDLKENLHHLAEKFYHQQGEISSLYRILYKAFSEVEDPEIREALAQNYQESLEVLQGLLGKTLEKEKLVLSKERLYLITMFMWGIGDMMWKNHTFGSTAPVGKKVYEEFANIIYEMIIRGE